MKAIVIQQPGGPEVLAMRDVPDPVIGPSDVLVEVRATALNRADLLQRMGLYPQPDPVPEYEIPGLEYAGEIVAIGAAVAGFAVGDRVMGIVSGGAYAERLAVHHRLPVKVPERLSFGEAAAVPEAFITAHDALMQCSLVAGESVLVHAAGSGVGVAAIQVASLLGATPIIGTASSDAKLDAAKELGLQVGIDYKTKDFAEGTKAATDGRGVDVVLDFVGASYLERNLRALAVRGRMIVIGLLGGLKAELNLATVLNKRLRIVGTLLRARPMEEKAALSRAFEKSVVPHIASGRLRPVVDRTFKLDQAADAHRYMESNANFGKIVLEI